MKNINFTLRFTTDTGIGITAHFTGRQGRGALNIIDLSVFATKGHYAPYIVEINGHLMILRGDTCEHSMALAVINAARIASSSDDRCDLACEIVRDGFAALLKSKQFSDLAADLRGSIISDLTASDRSKPYRNFPAPSDCDPVTGEEYGTGA
jgi:hypothetical protein